MVRGDIEARRSRCSTTERDALLAVDAVNQAGDYMAVRKALTQGATIPAEAVADSSVALRELIVPRAIGA